MSDPFVKVRRSRKERVCDMEFAHDMTIRPGDLYAVVKAPPGDWRTGSNHWERAILCRRCAEDNGHIEVTS